MDPAGENQKLAKHARSSDWTILQPLDFVFTSQDTPQHNSLVELAFPYIAGTARMMMEGALVQDEMQAKVTLEAIACATQLDGLVVIDLNGKVTMWDMHMFGANPKWTKNLQVWGEGRVVTVR